MKKIFILLFPILLCCSLSCYSQYLSFDQLLYLHDKDIVGVEEYLTVRSWTFYDSKQSSYATMNVATFSYSKSEYSDKALLWLKFMYSDISDSKRISYQLGNPTEYSNLVNRVKSAGYKLIKTNVLDGEIEKVYSNDKKTVVLSSSKSEDYFNSSTIYSLFLLDTEDYTLEFSE